MFRRFRSAFDVVEEVLLACDMVGEELARPDRLGGASDRDHVVGQVGKDIRARADDGPRTDRHTRPDKRICRDPCIIPDRDRRRKSRKR